jgi:uncharacterized phosphosugar-binding protein
MDDIHIYIEGLKASLEKIEAERRQIDAAAGLIADALSRGRLAHVFGTEAHTSALAGELFFKSGGLVGVNPLFDPALDLSHGAYRAALCRDMAGLAPCILDYYENIEPGDPIILLSGDPDSVIFEEAVGRAAEKGLNIIAIAPLGGSDGNASLKKAGVVIDAHSGEDFGGANTVCMSAILNCVAMRALKLAKGAETWNGGRLVEPDENKELIEKYIDRIKHL